VRISQADLAALWEAERGEDILDESIERSGISAELIGLNSDVADLPVVDCDDLARDPCQSHFRVLHTDRSDTPQNGFLDPVTCEDAGNVLEELSCQTTNRRRPPESDSYHSREPQCSPGT